MVVCGMDQHYSLTFTTFDEMEKDNQEQSVLINSSELQSVTDYSKMCHCRSVNVTQLLLITDAAVNYFYFFFKELIFSGARSSWKGRIQRTCRYSCTFQLRDEADGVSH